MPKPKRAQGNQHNSRHENGIVAPGKRVTKQKSNGQLNGSVEAFSPGNAAQSAIPTAHTTAISLDNITNGIPTTAKYRHASTTSIEPGSLIGERENVEDISATGICSEDCQGHVRPSVDAKIAGTQLLPRDSALNLAVTIIRACPIGDTIAILLVLLWLPPTLLTVTNALFAVLTFMPSTAALPSFPASLNDMLVGSGNTPSLATMFVTDMIGLLLWLVMWSPIQALAIELAQAVVATTLGGGSSTKKKGSDSTLFCMSLVTLNHVVRYDWLPQQILGFDWPAILSSIPYVSKPLPSFSVDDQGLTTRSPTGWLRALVALHILIQGVVHVARRWYQKRECSQLTAIHKKTESEPGTPSYIHWNCMSHLDNAPHIESTAAQDMAFNNLSKEARERLSSSKQRKRQGTLVRSQQPLWAAFAATKLTVLREYETTLAMRDVAESKAVDERDLGNAPFNQEEGRVWIFDVLPDCFRFQTSTLPTLAMDGTYAEDRCNDRDDKQRQLYVRVNETNWTSTKVDTHYHTNKTKTYCTGEVFGLVPSSSYRCTFVHGEGGGVLYSATVTTPPLLPAVTGKMTLNLSGQTEATHATTEPSAFPSERTHQIYKPSSPTSPKTTLIRSIKTLEASLADAQTRQKRSRKDGKAASTTYKRDIDFLKAKVEKLASEDKTHINRHMQWNQNTRQAEEAIATISAEIDALGSLPGEDVKLFKEMKSVWDEVKKAQVASRDSLSRTREAAHRDKLSAQTEATTSQQKRERLSARSAKLHDQHEKLNISTSQTLDEKQRRDSEQAEKDLERAKMEQQCTEQMANVYRAYQDSRLSTQQAWHEVQSMEAAFREHQILLAMPTPEERPLTPEGDLPGTNPHVTSSASRIPMFGSPDTPSPGQRSHSDSLRQPTNRPRSTSGLSGHSVYADFEDQDPAPPMPARAVEKIKQGGQRGRKLSGGSGSGSSGSQRDPASPSGGNGVQPSPVGKRSPGWNY